MDKNKYEIIKKRIDQTIENLNKNHMEAFFIEKSEDIPQKLQSLLNEGDTITVGGSQTLFEANIIPFLKSGKYNYLDRYKEGLSRDEVNQIFQKAFFADAYITSTNAITQKGELYNVDGNSNRIAAMLFGPKKVIVIASYNKIVRDLNEAIQRVKTIAAPANSVRLGCETYCSKTGECVSLKNENPQMSDGCDSDTRICANYAICAKQRNKDRIKVIITMDELGY